MSGKSRRVVGILTGVGLIVAVSMLPATAAKRTTKKAAKKTGAAVPVATAATTTIATPTIPETTIATTTTIPAVGCPVPELVPAANPVVTNVDLKTVRVDFDAVIVTKSVVRPTNVLVLSARDVVLNTAKTAGATPFTISVARRVESGTDCVDGPAETFEARVNFANQSETALGGLYLSDAPFNPGALMGAYLQVNPKAVDIFSILGRQIAPSSFTTNLKVGASWPLIKGSDDVDIRVTDGGPTVPKMSNGATGDVVMSGSTIAVNAKPGTGSITGKGTTRMVLRFSTH